MGTRSGDVDPAVVGHVAGAAGRSEADVLADLNRSSGLLGLCGDSDMREIVARTEAGDADAELALDVFCHRIRKYVGAYVAVLGGCDALVFTAGIGEHSAEVRARVCEGLEVFGIALDDERNQRSDRVISPEGCIDRGAGRPHRRGTRHRRTDCTPGRRWRRSELRRHLVRSRDLLIPRGTRASAPGPRPTQ
jgi:acetate kinase